MLLPDAEWLEAHLAAESERTQVEQRGVNRLRGGAKPLVDSLAPAGRVDLVRGFFFMVLRARDQFLARETTFP